MLGVMTVRKDELKFREFDRYRGFYCGLCRAIGRRCGRACRMALSFEMTFLSMLLTSLYEPETKDEMRRCAFHPIEKRLMLGNEAIDYCATAGKTKSASINLRKARCSKQRPGARVRRFPAKGKRWSGMSPICTRLSRKTI